MTIPPYQTYNQEPASWVREIPAGWTLEPLRYSFNFQNGEVFNSKDWGDGGIKIIRIQNLNGGEEFNTISREMVPDRCMIARGDLLFGWSGNKGTSFGPFIWKGDGEYALNQHIFKVTPRRIYKNFGYWSLKAVTARIEDEAQGIIGMVHITKGDLGSFKIPVPSYSEQIKIAKFLDSETTKIDALIAEQERLIELLQEKRQAVISHAVTKGINPNAPMKDSGVEWLGEVPKHWEISPLNYALKAVGDVDHYMPESVDSGIPYAMTGDLEDIASNINLIECKQVSEEDYEKLSKKIQTQKGDLILARYATIGTVSYVDIDEKLLVSYSCVTIKVNPEKVAALHLFYFIKSQAFAEGIKSKINSNTQDNVGIGDLKKILIALPPMNEQMEIIEYLQSAASQADEQIQVSRHAVHLLKERRSALISAAVTGQIDVRGLVSEDETA